MAMSLVAAIGLTAALPAAAQIRSYVDEHGRRVFVNADPSAPARTQALAVARPLPAALRPPLQTTGGPRASYSRDDLVRLAHEAAERHDLDPALIRAVIEAESAWNPRAVSHKGAQGLMQLIPATAERLGVRDPFDPVQNLDGGVRYLRWLLERYAGDLEKSLAAYNAGEGAVDRAGGVPHFAETRAYVDKVTSSYYRTESGRGAHWWNAPPKLYRYVDERGRLVFTNQ